MRKYLFFWFWLHLYIVVYFHVSDINTPRLKGFIYVSAIIPHSYRIYYVAMRRKKV